MSSAERRCFLCSVPCGSWADRDVAQQTQRSERDTMIDSLAGTADERRALGQYRADALVQHVRKPQLAQHLTAHGLESFRRLPDVMHVIENHSQQLAALLHKRCSASTMAALNDS